MTTERQAQVRQPFDLTEDRVADVAMWVPVGHTNEDIDGVFVGAMALLRELALGQQLERGAPEPQTAFSRQSQPCQWRQEASDLRDAIALVSRTLLWQLLLLTKLDCA